MIDATQADVASMARLLRNLHDPDVRARVLLFEGGAADRFGVGLVCLCVYVVCACVCVCVRVCRCGAVVLGDPARALSVERRSWVDSVVV